MHLIEIYNSLLETYTCEYYSLKMPKAQKSSKCEQHTSEIVDSNPSAHETSDEESASSEQEIYFNPQPSTSRSAQVMPSYMPYIEGSTMDWTVIDGLYNRFLKWHLKCENILECALVMLLESRKCKKVLAWSSDFGLDQYISWNLSSKDVTLDTIWKKFEEFCHKPMS